MGGILQGAELRNPDARTGDLPPTPSFPRVGPHAARLSSQTGRLSRINPDNLDTVDAGPHEKKSEKASK